MNFNNVSLHPKRRFFVSKIFLLIIIIIIYIVPFPKSCSKALNIVGLTAHNVDQTIFYSFKDKS